MNVREESMKEPTGRHINLDCGIAYGRIEAWLRNELGLPFDDGAWIFKHADESCRIRIAPLEPRSLGSVSLERCNLTANGSAAAIDAFKHLFTLRFMSAGG